MKISLIGLCAATGILASGMAQAQEAAPAVTTNLSLTSNYKYRGQDQSDNRPAIQGGFDYAHSSGFYIGNWNSSVGFTDAGIEMDVYGGYKGAITESLGYDVGVLRYQYPSLAPANTTELYGALSFGPVTGKVSYTASKKYFGFEEGRGTLYFDLSANYEVITGLTLNAHIGTTRFSSDSQSVATANGGSLPDYYDYKLGATYDLGSGFSAAGAIVGANKKNVYGDINKARVIFTITKAM